MVLAQVPTCSICTHTLPFLGLWDVGMHIHTVLRAIPSYETSLPWHYGPLSDILDMSTRGVYTVLPQLCRAL